MVLNRRFGVENRNRNRKSTVEIENRIRKSTTIGKIDNRKSKKNQSQSAIRLLLPEGKIIQTPFESTLLPTQTHTMKCHQSTFIYSNINPITRM